MEACRVLTKAIKQQLQVVYSSSSDASTKDCALLTALLARAKAIAKTWCKVSPTPESPEKELLRVIAQVKMPLVKGMASSHQTPDEQNKLGEDLVEALEVVAAVLRASYTDPAWNLDDTGSYLIQKEFRMFGKCVPLCMVENCDALKRLVFMEEPWSVFGLDRLDFIGVESIDFGVKDPFETKDHEDDVFREKLARSTGGETIGLNEIEKVAELVRGPNPRKQRRDMTPHHMCSFSMTVIQRLARTHDSPLHKAAIERVVEFYDSEISLWAGGEFIGYAMTTV
jgi:hypothetical protein